jgi:hypothetical protein
MLSNGTQAWISAGSPVSAAIGDQRLNGDAISILVSTSTEVQANPIAYDGAGGLFATWTDSRTSGSSGLDVYVQRMASNGSVAGGWPANGAAACTQPATRCCPVSWWMERAA